MSATPSAGDFEMRFSEKLAGRIISGEPLTIELVRECYERAGDELNLQANAADDLHIEDIFGALKSKNHQLPSLGQRNLTKIIFDCVYMH